MTTPASGLVLRAGAPDDAPAVLALFDEAAGWLAERGRSDQWGAEPWSARPEAVRRVQRLCASPGFVAAVQDGSVVGALVLEPHPTSYVPAVDEPERFVHLLITSRRTAGRGIGAALLTHARALTLGAGVDLLRVDCFAGGDGALVAWYRSAGFTPSRRLDVNGWPCQVLEQRLLSEPGARFDELRTDRLLLRHWTSADRAPFAALNADPQVMRHFPSPLDAAASDAMVERLESRLDEQGWGLWAVQRLDTGQLIGFTGLNPADDLPPSPAVEVGWRLAREHWGQGFAPEAARAALAVAFRGLALDEVVSFTTTANASSRRVMTKLGLTHRPERDFDHPRTPGWHGQRHVLYAISRREWSRRQGWSDDARTVGTVPP